MSDLIKYFHDKANGIFWWVVLVLQRLEKARSEISFQKSIKKASEASGSMEHFIFHTLTVQIIHETFRSFLFDVPTCPKDFLIDTAAIHNHVATTCLQSLLVDDRTTMNKGF